MPCPFLNRLSSAYIRNYGASLLKGYAQHCPMMSRFINTDFTSSEAIESGNVSPVNKCPFLSEIKPSVKEASIESQEDVLQMSSESSSGETFNYDEFFHEQIMRKKKDHSYRVFKKVNRLAEKFPTGLECTFNEQPITIWCANDYLGMTRHPQVKEAVRNALERYGSGTGGTRNLSGNTNVHEQLERELANLHRKEAALLFTSCYVANDSTLSTLASALPGCQIFSDERNHASMIAGIRHSRMPKHIFRHNDADHLHKLLSAFDKKIPKIVAFETVYSMNGSICPLNKLLEVSHEHGALAFVDEVHAVGLYGDHGAGVGERDGVLEKMDIISGTLGKAFGNMGGYIVGTKHLVDMVRSYAAGFIFTTSLPPTIVAGGLAAVKVLASSEGVFLRQKQKENVSYLKKKLIERGFPVEQTSSHIIPVRIGDPFQSTLLTDRMLREKGHYIQSINYPTVPRGEEKLRITPTPFHTPPMIDEFVDDLLEMWISLKLPLSLFTCCSQCKKTLSFGGYVSEEKRSCSTNGDNFHSTNEKKERCLQPNCPQIVTAY